MRAKITARKPQFQFDADVPKQWIKDAPFRTHLFNSFTLLFPTGENFFIRSLQKFVPAIKDE